MDGRRTGVVAAAVAAVIGVAVSACAPPPPPTSTSVPPPPHIVGPTLDITPSAGGLAHPWDIDWLPDKTLLFTQRDSGLYALKSGAPVQLTSGGSDFWAAGETGMMGLAVDPRFGTNGRLYTCQGSTDDSPVAGHANSVKVVAWQLDPGVTTATKVHDVVTGIDATNGFHGGCRLEFDGGSLWVTTGDGAYGPNPQDLSSLAGKVLRVNPDGTNVPVAGNPYAAWPFGKTNLIFTYGHRNVQGLAVQPGGTVFTSEHGTDRDDEVNALVAGQNYGYDPVPSYNQAVPMTDWAKYPGSITAKWTSDFPTVAPSGMTFLSGGQWLQWAGTLALTTLKDSRLHLQFYVGTDFRGELIPPQFDRTFGRLRTVQQGPDGCLYVLTANGTNDQILRACPV